MNSKLVVVTGGTSGLGIEIVKKFLDKQYRVISLGRSEGNINHPLHSFVKCDFASLEKVKQAATDILKVIDKADILINNAAILSSPEYSITEDGFELSYQVNFLAHVYFFELLRNGGVLENATVINTTSPIRTLGKLDLDWVFDKSVYGTIKAYSSSKMYMSLFARYLAALGLESYAFDPGTFRSGIYRAQKPWFHTLYRIGGPFLIHSKHVASDYMKVYDRNDRINGSVYNRKGRLCAPDKVDESVLIDFWEKVKSQLSPKDMKADF